MNAVHDHRSPDAIAYISPTFSGFHAAVAAVATNNNAALNAGDTFDAYSLTGIYENGPLFVSLSYQTVDEADTALGLFTDTNLNGTLDAGEVSGGIVDGSDAWKLGVGYAFGDLKLGLVYENVGVDITGGGDVDIDGWMVNAAYGMGPITLKAAYNTHTLESTALGADVDADGWILGADYALSKRTTAYIIYRTDDVDAGAGTDKDGWGLGVKHSF
jgi:predicted porin